MASISSRPQWVKLLLWHSDNVKSLCHFYDYPDSNAGWANAGRTSGRQYRCWANLHCCLGSLWNVLVSGWHSQLGWFPGKFCCWQNQEPIHITTQEPSSDASLHIANIWFLAPDVSWDFARSHWPIWMMSSDRGRSHRTTRIQRNMDENMRNFITCTLSADGTAP